jgi:FKBP-type peptidyl-prolyl cis-trans isomerase SlyD
VEPTLSIGPDTHVTISYTLFDQEGTQVTDDGERVTISYVHGYGQILPALERGLAGEARGTHLSVVAEPEDAFGPHESDGVFEIDREGLELEGGEKLEPGVEVVASGPDGEFLMRVLEVRPDSLLVDTNHPLAGKRVRFEVDVLEVRAATDVEVEEAQRSAEDDDDCGCGHPHHH